MSLLVQASESLSSLALEFLKFLVIILSSSFKFKMK
jgi:hypothetical protein